MNPIENLTSNILSFTLFQRKIFTTFFFAAIFFFVVDISVLVFVPNVFACIMLLFVVFALLFFMRILRVRMNAIAHNEASKFFLRAVQVTLEQFISRVDHQFDSQKFMDIIVHELKCQRISWFTLKGMQFDWILPCNNTKISGLTKGQTSVQYNLQVVGIVEHSCYPSIPSDRIGVLFHYEKIWCSATEIEVDPFVRKIYLYASQGIF
jgi:hypothetical protein